MKKSRRFDDTFFAVEIIDRATKLLSEKPDLLKFDVLDVEMDAGVSWSHDKVEEFYSDYRLGPRYVHFRCAVKTLSLSILVSSGRDTVVSMDAPSRAEVEQVLRIFEDAAPSYAVPQPPEKRPSPVVFIGHGHSSLWRDLKDHLHEKHGYEVEAYEIGARAGHTIRDILDGMLRRSTFALLVMTAEDEHVDATLHARENVIHELGLFQGELGFSRAIILLEEGASEFSNIRGVHEIRFAKGNIKETYGEVLATLRRELDNRPAARKRS